MTNLLLTRLRISPQPGPWRTAAAAPFVMLAAYLVVQDWLYPLWPHAIGALDHLLTADPALDGAWGGPTLAGAWFVHAMLALGMQVCCLAVIRTLHRPAK